MFRYLCVRVGSLSTRKGIVHVQLASLSSQRLDCQGPILTALNPLAPPLGFQIKAVGEKKALTVLFFSLLKENVYFEDLYVFEKYSLVHKTVNPDIDFM